jgi:hypothetical protein
MDAKCCKNLIPGVVLLPAGSKVIPSDPTTVSEPAESKGIAMTVGVGVAIGIAGFLIIAPIIACSVWFCTPAKKRQSPEEGNVMTKKNRNSASSDYSDSNFITYAAPNETDLETIVESD